MRSARGIARASRRCTRSAWASRSSTCILGACMEARLLHLLAPDRGLRPGAARGGARGGAARQPEEGSRGKARAGSLRGRQRPRRLAAGASSRTPSRKAPWGVALFLRGRWKEARETLDASSAKAPGIRSQWHSNAVLFAVRSLYFSGEIRELVRRQARLLADAQDRGDLYTLVNCAATTTIDDRTWPPTTPRARARRPRRDGAVVADGVPRPALAGDGVRAGRRPVPRATGPRRTTGSGGTCRR